MRILTYNIRGGLGMDRRRDIARIAGVIRDSGADVVCLQEVHQRVPWSGMSDQSRQLGKILGWPVVFQRNLNVGIGGEGVATASHFHLVDVKRHRLPGGREARGMLETRWQTPGGQTTIFNTHWGLSEDERERQARQTASIVNAAAGPKTVCGDFNARPDSTALRFFLTETGLMDADANENRPTYPADAPRARIDFVFFSDDWQLKAVTALETSASDHLPLVADLERAVGVSDGDAAF